MKLHRITVRVSGTDLPPPVDPLVSGTVSLRFQGIFPGAPAFGLVPAYRFAIVADGVDVGSFSFRVGDNDHVRLTAGHIGYNVEEGHRGHGYARLACLAAAPLVSQFYDEVIITCDPENLPSIRTIEGLGAAYVDEVPVPPHDPHYARGSRHKRRYVWKP